MPRIPHTATNRGKRVRVVLRDGTQIDDRFESRNDRWIVLQHRGRVNKADIRAFIVLKTASDGATTPPKETVVSVTRSMLTISRGNLVIEYVGQMHGQAAQTLSRFEQTGALHALMRLTHDMGPRTVQLLNSFVRKTRYALVSSILPLPNGRGVRLRIKPEGQLGFIAVILVKEGETANGLAKLLERKNETIFGPPPVAMLPNDPQVVRRAVEAVRTLDSNAYQPGPDDGLLEFADRVAEEIGPSEDPGYWFKALCAGEELGKLFRDGTRFMVIEPLEDEKSLAPAVSAIPMPVQSSSATAMMPTPVLLPLPPVDLGDVQGDQATELLAENADDLIEAIQAVRAARADRQTIVHRIAEVRHNLALAEAAYIRDLEAVDKRLAEARAKVNPDMLLLLADVGPKQMAQTAVAEAPKPPEGEANLPSS